MALASKLFYSELYLDFIFENFLEASHPLYGKLTISNLRAVFNSDFHA